MKRLLLLILFLLSTSSKAIDLCEVDRYAYPGFLPGIYRVVISVKENCPPGGYAVVRLVSGREYPWEVISKGRPYVEKGVPWYWKGQWLSNSAKVYTFNIPNMKPPFSTIRGR